MASDDWASKRAKAAGPPDRKVRFEVAGRALGEARQRNRPVDDGGAACPVLIEGKKDEVALRRLGFTGPVERVNRGWDRERLAAHLYETYGTRNQVDNGDAIILLMDWDRTGGRLQHDIGNSLEGFDMRIDTRTRMELARALKPEGRTVESLGAHAPALREAMREHDPEGEEE